MEESTGSEFEISSQDINEPSYRTGGDNITPTCSEDACAVIEGQNFPTDVYLLILDGLNQVHYPTFHPHHLAVCVKAATLIFRKHDRVLLESLPPEIEMARKFIRESLVVCYERCLRDEAFLRYHESNSDRIFEAIYWLVSLSVELCGLRLSLPTDSDMQDGYEVELDLVPVFTALGWTFDKNAELYLSPFCAELPGDGAVELGDDSLDMDCSAQSVQVVSPSMETDSSLVKDSSPWLCFFLQHFSKLQGFQHLKETMQTPARYFLTYHEVLLSALRQIFECDSGVNVSQFQEGCTTVLRYLLQLIEQDQERLADFGKDRIYQSFSRILDHLYGLLSASSSRQAADEQVLCVQRSFVDVMLRSSNFNKLLSAVRECNKLLTRSKELCKLDQGKSLQMNVGWMNQHKIIKQMLRANLHQRQYAELVLSILLILTEFGYIKEEHLDMLWSVTEQEDTFDVVKTNVYVMLAELAASLTPEQLDMLFRKFEVSKGRSLADTIRLLDLLKRLAASDSEAACMADKVLNMIWELTIPADSPPELLECNIIQDVLKEYDVKGHHALLEAYMARCIEQINLSENIFTSLHVLRALLSIYPDSRRQKDVVSRSKAVKLLNSKFDVLELLVSKLNHFLCRGRAAVIQLQTVADGVPPGQGSYTYHQIVEEYIRLISFIAECQSSYFQHHLAEVLWDALVLNPVTPEDQVRGMNFFLSGASERSTQFFELGTLKLLLENHITQLPVHNLSPFAWNLFEEYFRRVNLEEKKLVFKDVEPGNTAMVCEDMDLLGLDYLWKVALDCSRQDVIHKAMHVLLILYRGQPERTFWTEFIRKCTCTLMDSVSCLCTQPVMDWKSAQPTLQVAALPEHDAAQRHVLRSLLLLHRMLDQSQGRTMPPVPAHRASYKGTHVTLDVQSPQSTRFRVSAHSNEYVGAIRHRIAQHLGCPPWRLRLLYAGKEWNNDALLVCQLELKNRQILNTGVSPQDNSFTKPPESYKESWEQCSPNAVLSREDNIYNVLFFLAALPDAADVRQEAIKLLQQLPTCPDVPTALRDALIGVQPYEKLRQLLFEHVDVLQPAKLIYTLQALHGLVFSTASAEDFSEAEDETSSLRVLAVSHLHDTFIASGCIRLLIEVVQESTSKARSDINFLRELHSLVVLMIGSVYTATIAQGSAQEASDNVAAKQAHGKTPAERASSCNEGNANEPSPSSSSTMDTVGAEDSATSGEVKEKLPELDQETLGLITSLLTWLAYDAGRLWGVDNPKGIRDSEFSSDVQLVRDSLSILQRMLDSNPRLFSSFLADPQTPPLVEVILMNPHYSHVRTIAADMLNKICLSSNNADAHIWLFGLMLALRSLAHNTPQYSAEFYQLFIQLVETLQDINSPSEFAQAEQLLKEECASLQHVTRLVADDYAVALEGKLALIRALIKCLDRNFIGPPGEVGLMKSLLQKYLFPESYTLFRMQNEDGCSLLALSSALDVCCNNPNCRKAALELVADLMTGSPATLEEGVTLLCNMHYNPGLLNEGRWELQPQAHPRPAHGYVGLKNAGATCYMNAVLQQLYMQPKIRELVLAAKGAVQEEYDDSVFQQLQITFSFMFLSRQGFFVPNGFWAAFKDYDGQPIDLREHQDAYEFFTRLQDFVDQHLRSSQQTPAMQLVMGGRFVQQIICRGIDYRSEHEEDFYQISVDVKGKNSLEKSLESYVQGELMEGENAYFCEEVGQRVTAVKRSCIKDLPHTLVIHLKRFEYDYHNMTRYKVRERFEFPLALDMFKYTADGLAAAEAQNTAAPAPTRPYSYYQYELKGIVVHSGTAFAGHYYSYIKERPKVMPDGRVLEGSWFCFDDKVVRPWDPSKLETDCYGGRSSQDYHSHGGRNQPRNDIERPHSAYMLFYERADSMSYDTSAVQLAACGSPASSPGNSFPPAASAGSGAPLPAAIKSSCTTPYNMPVQLYEGVMLGNLELVQRAHLLDKDYFRFVRSVVEAKWDPHSSARKTRRKDPPSGSGSSGKMHSMSCDSDAAEMSTAPAQRLEAVEVASIQAMRLAASFLFAVYWPANQSLRSDLPLWKDTLGSLLALSPATSITLLRVLVLDHKDWLAMYLLRAPHEVRKNVVMMLNAILAQLAEKGVLQVPASGLPGDREQEQQHQAHLMHLQVVMHYVQELAMLLHTAMRHQQLDVAALLQVLTDIARRDPYLCAHLGSHRVLLAAMDLAITLYHRMVTQDEAYGEELHACHKLMYAMLSHVSDMADSLAELEGGPVPSPGQVNPYCCATDLVLEHVMGSKDREAWYIFTHQNFLRTLLHPTTLGDKDTVALAQLLQWENARVTSSLLPLVVEAMEAMGETEVESLADNLWSVCYVMDRFTDERLRGVMIGLPNNTGRGMCNLGIYTLVRARPGYRKLIALWLFCQAIQHSQNFKAFLKQVQAVQQEEGLEWLRWVVSLLERSQPNAAATTLVKRLNDIRTVLEDLQS